jgi:hypothetical protein
MRQGETGCGSIPLSVAAGSPGARSIGYGLWLLRLQPFVRRSRRAVVILASPKTLGHSPKARLVVTMMEVRW